MSGREHDISEESAILTRLAQAHKVWRDQRPPPPVRSPEEQLEMGVQILRGVQHPVPQDIEAISEASADPLRWVIQSQLGIVGWRLYAKGGAGLITTIFRAIESDHHPGFSTAVAVAWRKLGFPNDPRGVWTRASLR